MEVQTVLNVLHTLRVSPGVSEMEIHARIAQELQAASILCVHEAKLASRCRIDFLAGDIGIEVKCGKPPRCALVAQLVRYAACPQIRALVVVVERSANLPKKVGGKPCHFVSLNRLWGIALPT